MPHYPTSPRRLKSAGNFLLPQLVERNSEIDTTVGAVCDRAQSLSFGKMRGHRPRLQKLWYQIHCYALLEEPPCVRTHRLSSASTTKSGSISSIFLRRISNTPCAAGYSLGFHLFHLLHNTQNISAQNLLDVAFGVTFCQQCRGQLR